MSSTAIDIKNILVAEGIGVLATSIFVGVIPDNSAVADIAIGILDSGGYAPTSDYVIDNPTVQIIVRGVPGGYAAAYNKAEEIKEVLHDLHNESYGEDRYLGIWAASDILFLEFDGMNRPLFSVNFEVLRTDK